MTNDEVERHRGEWVAVDMSNGQVVASHEDLLRLEEALDRDGVAQVHVRRIPRLDDPMFFGLL